MVASGSASKGLLELENVPSGDITIEVTPKEGYKGVSKRITLGSGEDKSLTVEVPLDLNLEMLSSMNLTAGIGCSSNFNLEVRNVMNKAVNVSFIGEGDLADWIKVENAVVDAKKAKSFNVKIEIPADYELENEFAEKTGAIRIKGSELKTDLSVVIVPGGSLEISSEELSLSGRQGEKLTERIGISNEGIGKIVDIKVDVSGDIKDWMKVSIGKTSLEEDEETNLNVNIAVPLDAGEGKHNGRIDIFSGCGSKKINVYVEVSPLEVELTTEPSEISSEVYAGNADSVNLKISNPSEIGVNATLSLRGEISDWVSLSSDKVSIKGEGTTTITITIEPPYELQAGSYSGRIEIEYMGRKINVPVSVRVLGEGSEEE